MEEVSGPDDDGAVCGMTVAMIGSWLGHLGMILPTRQ